MCSQLEMTAQVETWWVDVPDDGLKRLELGRGMIMALISCSYYSLMVYG